MCPCVVEAPASLPCTGSSAGTPAFPLECKFGLFHSWCSHSISSNWENNLFYFFDNILCIVLCFYSDIFTPERQWFVFLCAVNKNRHSLLEHAFQMHGDIHFCCLAHDHVYLWCVAEMEKMVPEQKVSLEQYFGLLVSVCPTESDSARWEEDELHPCCYYSRLIASECPWWSLLQAFP